MQKTIDDFHAKLTFETVNEVTIYENDLLKGYKFALGEMATNYSDYRSYVSKFLSSLEANNLHSISYSLTVFFELYERVINTGKFKPFDLSITDYECTEETLNKLKLVFSEAFSINNQHRISENHFNIISLSEIEKKEMASLLISKLQNDCEQLSWTKDTIEGTMMHMPFLRQILNSLENGELFYHAIGLVFDRLYSSEYYQIARDLAEEVILSSYKDDVPALGYFNSFRLYSNLGSIHAAIFYANLSMTCILQLKEPYSEKYVKEVIWQCIKFFRNVNLFTWVGEIYNTIPPTLNFLEFERRSIDHSFFSSLVAIREPNLPASILDYLNKEREEVISNGISEALPWLLTLYNVKRLYPEADFSPIGLGFFLNIFETIVPPETVQKNKDIIFGKSDNLKIHLIESLIKLNETRNLTDFVYDNEYALKIANKLIVNSSLKKDPGEFLLSMILKADFSILFQTKKAPEITKLILPDTSSLTFETLYDNNESLFQKLPISLTTSLIWLAHSEANVYQLELFNKNYSFCELNYWSDEILQDLINTEFFFEIKFAETIKDSGGIRMVSPEEYSAEDEKIAKRLKFMTMLVADNATEIYMVKDMHLSNFPHNLFLNSKGDFVSRKTPITNVLSTEWLIQAFRAKSLKVGYSKAIWIPTESQDFILHFLYSKIEQTLQDNSFAIFKEVSMAKPISSDINIVCSHGAKNISETYLLYQEDHSTNNLNSIIGEGKIVIFFVCYSGSMTTEFFRNNVSSMVKRFITQGYEAVIAPYWALDVTIPGLWLPEFLNSFNSGLSISQSVFNANVKVMATYPTPAAWACLHLYGNPNIMVKD